MRILRAFFCLIFMVAIGIHAQIMLSYETHSLQAGYVHVNQNIKNVDEGMSGENCLWDFSKLICGEVSRNEIINAYDSPQFSFFENATIVSKSGDSQYFYKLNEEKLEYLGYLTKDAIITFDNPLLRMKYPFAYKDKIEGSFAGTGIHYGSVYTSITGTYAIEADAKGTLLLPNGINITNAFRIKSVEYFVENSCKTAEWIIKKYLWYTTGYRYPVFSVIHTEIKDGANSSESHNAYYNEEAISLKSIEIDQLISELRLIVYPNPAKQKFNIQYFVSEKQNVSVALFNISGSKLRDIVKTQSQLGEYEYEIDCLKTSLVPGVYLVNFTFGNRTLTKKIIIED